jgi:hypothetical protein
MTCPMHMSCLSTMKANRYCCTMKANICCLVLHHQSHGTET